MTDASIPFLLAVLLIPLAGCAGATRPAGTEPPTGPPPHRIDGNGCCVADAVGSPPGTRTWVVVSGEIQPDGTVERARAEVAYNPESRDAWFAAAVRCMTGWRFEPARSSPAEARPRPFFALLTVDVGEPASSEDCVALVVNSYDDLEGRFRAPELVDRSAYLRYPPAALRQRVQATVRLVCTIDETGRTKDFEVLEVQHDGMRARQADPYGFAKAAIEAVRLWRYSPARFDGRPVPVRSIIQVTFSVG